MTEAREFCFSGAQQAKEPELFEVAVGPALVIDSAAAAFKAAPLSQDGAQSHADPSVEFSQLADYLRSCERFNEAFGLMERGDWQDALKGFRASAAINDRNAPCHGNMGICHAQLGHKAEALAELDRALEIDSKCQPAISNRKLAEQMEEGRPLENTVFKSVNHSMENFMKKRQ